MWFIYFEYKSPCLPQTLQNFFVSSHFDEIELIIFLLFVILISEKHFYNSRSGRYFFPRGFIIRAITLSSIIYFDLIIVYDVM